MKEPQIYISDESMRRVTVRTIESATVEILRPVLRSRCWTVQLRVSGRNLFADMVIAHAFAYNEEEAHNIAAVFKDLCLMKKGVD